MKIEIFLNQEDFKFLAWLSERDTERCGFEWNIDDEIKTLIVVKIRDMKEMYEKRGLYKEEELVNAN